MGVNEHTVIDWVRRAVPEDRWVTIPPGDDCGAFAVPPGETVLVTTDNCIEGVHFEANVTPWEQVGRKAVCRGISDIAAMGCRPRYLIISLTAGPSLDLKGLRALHRGILGAADQFNLYLLGGDTSSHDGPTQLCVTAFAGDGGLRPIRRSGAKVGDVVCVSGQLGGSLLGHHLAFNPRIELGVWLNQKRFASSMIDVTDGLSTDLLHLVTESGRGVEIEAHRIPISQAARRLSSTTRTDPLEHALGDGEDYELLFTCPMDRIEALRDATPPIGITEIGVITASGAYLVEEAGVRRELKPSGWVHRMGDQRQRRHGK